MEEKVLGLGYWGQTEIFVAVAISLTAFLLFWHSRFTAGRRLPPGPKGWPLVGAIPYLGEFPQESLFELSKKHGPLMYLHLGSLPTLVVSNAEMAREVLQKHDQLFASRPHFLVADIISYGRKDVVWVPYGPRWREVRKMVNLKLMTTSRLNHFTKTLKKEILTGVHTVLEQSQSGGKDGINVTHVLNGMTMNLMTMMMWNKRKRNVGGSQSERTSDARFEQLFKDVEAILGINIADFLPSFLKSFAMRVSGLERRARRIHGEVDDFCESIVREKEQALALSKEGSSSSTGITDEDDFVDGLLKLMNGSENSQTSSQALSRDATKALLMDMVIAGTNTTSMTLDWILAQLLKSPDIMKKAQDELTAVVGEDRLVSEEDIPKLKYLDAVVKEGLRKFSAAPLALPHWSMAKCRIGNYEVPANTCVFINIFAIHHDATAWESPFEFNPDRFLDSSKDFRGYNFDFIPFGSGRRSCPGMNHAATVLHIGLAQLLHAVSWSPPEGQALEDVDMTAAPGMTNPRAYPLMVTAKPRLAHHVIYPTAT